MLFFASLFLDSGRYFVWGWARDENLKNEFYKLSVFERLLLALWVLVPLFQLATGESKTYKFFSAILGILGNLFQRPNLDLWHLEAALSGVVVLLFLAKPLLMRAAFAKPEGDFKVLWTSPAKYIVIVVGFMALVTFYLPFKFPQIVEVMKELAETAKPIDWFFGGIFEEVGYSLALYYLLLPCAGRWGSFALHAVFFALIHSYNAPYVFQVFFGSSIYLFLMLWSGSITLPVLVHLLANFLIFLIFTVGA